MRSKHRTSKKGSLKAGRPPTVKQQKKKSISSKATQKTIVTFHQLNRDLEKARREQNQAQALTLQKQIDALGGIKAYQQASIQGQAEDRGGDSSTVLLRWLEPSRNDIVETTPRLKMLEVGALSTKNACSRCGWFDMTHIDLHSQAAGIEQQDFMARPLPKSDDEKFDVISLSLVLNFVPDAKGRGEMLRRTTAFLRQRNSATVSCGVASVMSCLFLVLPASCVTKSRYFDNARLELIMGSLGYTMVHQKQTAKLVYYFWHFRGSSPAEKKSFPKVKGRDGATMNNFCVVLET